MTDASVMSSPLKGLSRPSVEIKALQTLRQQYGYGQILMQLSQSWDHEPCLLRSIPSQLLAGRTSASLGIVISGRGNQVGCHDLGIR